MKNQTNFIDLKNFELFKIEEGRIVYMVYLQNFFGSNCIGFEGAKKNIWFPIPFGRDCQVKRLGFNLNILRSVELRTLREIAIAIDATISTSWIRRVRFPRARAFQGLGNFLL